MKRIRHKDIRAVSHAWAYAAGGEGGANSNNSFSYTGGELYSYNTIIAKRIKTKKDGEVCLFNQGSYSNTTNRHQGLARQAFSGSCWVIGAWEDAERGQYVFRPENIIKSYLWKLEKETENLTKAKRETTRTRYTMEIGGVWANLKKLIELGILKKSELPAQLKQLLEIEIDQTGLEALKLAAEKALKKKLKAKKADILESIEAFRNFERSHISRDARDFCGGDLIRLETVETYKLATHPLAASVERMIRTSQGIQMPINEALRLYSACQLVIRNEGKFPSPIRDTRILLNGLYPLESIDNKGNAKVGCHFFKYEEIKRCYEKEYLPTIKN